MRTYLVRGVAVTALLLWVSAPGGAQEPAGSPERPPVPDEPALQNAPDEPSDETPQAAANVKPADSESPDEPTKDSPTEDEPTEADTEPEDAVSDDEFLQDPFSYLQSDMQSAVVDLKDGETRPPATVTQPRILKRFGLLIEQLERQGQGAGQAGQRVNRPAQQSSLMRGPGGQNEMRAPRDDGRDWADLTPKERQKILQSKTDGFPAGYDDVLADYFRRVARAQEAATSTAPAGDAPAGTSDEGSN